jgi:hypothetical protein
MSPLCGYLAILGSLLSAPGMPEQSYLITEEWREDGVCRLQAEPYYPQPGDLVFFSNPTAVVDDAFYWLASSRCVPEHCGIVVATPDGSLATLECAPPRAR